MRILVVESEPLTAFELTCALEEAGHEVIGPAPSSALALCLARAEPIDVALLGVDGGMRSESAHLAQVLRQRQGTLSLLFSGDQELAVEAESQATRMARQPCGCREIFLAMQNIRAAFARKQTVVHLESCR